MTGDDVLNRPGTDAAARPGPVDGLVVAGVQAARADTKFVGRSRALWAMLAPTLVVILEALEVRQGQEVVSHLGGTLEAILALAGPVMWLWHWLRPDPRQPVLAIKGGSAALAAVCLVGLSGPLLSGCATFGQAGATPSQKLIEAERTTTLALNLASDLVAELGPETVPRPVRMAIVETGEAVKAMFPEVRAWVALCATEEGCADSVKVELSVSTAKAAIDDALASMERICAERAEGCTSEGRVRLALVSVREAVDLVGRIVTEVMGDGG